jgi:hypothetical protein
MEKAVIQIQHKFRRGSKKRFACSHCGKTWVEIVGLFAGNTDEKEDTYFRIGQESEECQNCEHRSRTCPACSSKDIYQISFSADVTQNSLMSFDRIRIVSNT